MAVPQQASDLIVREPAGPGRTSSLSASTLLLTGHQAAVYTVQFSRDGEALASGSFDKEICEWVRLTGCTYRDFLLRVLEILEEQCRDAKGHRLGGSAGPAVDLGQGRQQQQQQQSQQSSSQGGSPQQPAGSAVVEG